MALREEDFLLKKKRELDEAMRALGIQLNADEETKEDPVDKFDFDMSALHKDEQDK